MENFLKVAVFVLLSATLSGCSTVGNSQASTRNSSKSLALQNIPFLSKKLSKYNARVFQDDNLAMVVLPNEKFFRDNSANFTNDAYRALDLILSLCSYYETSSVSVMGYSKDYADYELGKALAIERAHRVVNYLWRSGINANFVYADGRNLTFKKEKNGQDIFPDCTLIKMYKFIE
jgi:outer membrane protein OmpA-like peptidoglycan-associated protein